MTDSPMATAPQTPPSCFLCGAALAVKLTQSKTGRVAVAMACSRDGRHWRSFVNDHDYVAQVVARLESTRQN